jgi:RNA-directed DNA polymerase
VSETTVPASTEKLPPVLINYADDFVVLADQLTEELKGFIADRLENWMGLRINQEKTSSKQMEQIGTRLDFLGYSLRYDRDLHGRPCRYLNIFPSPKSLKRERAKLRQMTDKRQCFKPVSILAAELNRHLKGWANYYRHGYPRKAFRELNSYTRERMTKHLKRRSQRAYKVPAGKSYYKHLEDMGLIYL